MELAVGLGTLACLIVGCLIGVWAQRALPPHHLGDETKDIVKLGIGSIGTLSALVLGLIVASTKGSFDAKTLQIHQFSSYLVQLDRSLARFGTETQPTRSALRTFAIFKLGVTWPDEAGMEPADAALREQTEGLRLMEAVGTSALQLEPTTAVQRIVHSRIVDLYNRLADARWLLDTQAGSSIQPAFVALLVFWLIVMFTSIGLFSPRNATALAFVLLCAAAFSSALYLALDMDSPFGGPVRISSAPMHDAVAQLGR